MIIKLFLRYALLFIGLTTSGAWAYQEMHEPNIVYLEGMVGGAPLNIGMYEPAANVVVRDIGESCFKKTTSSDGKRLVLMFNTEHSCSGDLLIEISKFYQEALSKSSSDGVTHKIGAIEAPRKNGRLSLRSLFVEVSKDKKIITSLILE